MVFFHGGEETEAAWRILQEPRFRETAEVQLVVGAPFSSTVFALRSRYKFVCTEAAVQRFSHLFFDALLVSVTDLRGIIYQQALQRQQRTGYFTIVDQEEPLPSVSFSPNEFRA